MDIITPNTGHPYWQTEVGPYYVRGCAAWQGGKGGVVIVANKSQRTNVIGLDTVDTLMNAVDTMALKVAGEVAAPPASTPTPTAPTPDVAAIVQAVIAAMQTQQA